MAEAFQFELVAPERLLMSESVDQVVVPGSEGYFTVLKGHAPFMSTMPGPKHTAPSRRTGSFASVPTGCTVSR